VALTSTSWKPGQSGNPGGRPKVAREVRASAQDDTPEAYRIISGLMRDADKDSVRLSAAVKVLQIAGVPMSEVAEAAGEAAGQVAMPAQEPDVDSLLDAVARGEA
jgi:hypothetical protein